MTHLATLTPQELHSSPTKSLWVKATGKFYTPEFIVRNLIRSILGNMSESALNKEIIKIIEPFCGDGRLICQLLDEITEKDASLLKGKELLVDIWDCDEEAVLKAEKEINKKLEDYELPGKVNAVHGDAFAIGLKHLGKYDICITNPPWETLKPDRRDLEHISTENQETYISHLKVYDKYLREWYPNSSPTKTFSGWGTNLSRVGAELAFKLIGDNGICGIVLPATILADQVSENLRCWLFTNFKINHVAYYSAEGRFFEFVDQQSLTITGHKNTTDDKETTHVDYYNSATAKESTVLNSSEWSSIGANKYILPIQFGLDLLHLQSKFDKLPRFGDMESRDQDGLWAGRELDETGYKSFLSHTGRYKFVKGRMIDRFKVAEQPSLSVKYEGPAIPRSADFSRIAWRDVSRPNQKRRIQATIIPSGWVAGNSLNIAYFRDGNEDRLRALLGILNSFVFEAQLRSSLATGHVSLGSVRNIKVLDLRDDRLVRELSGIVLHCLKGDKDEIIRLEIVIAQHYGLDKEEFLSLIQKFKKITPEELTIYEFNNYWDIN